jgi:hypothetical protein
VLSRRTVRGCQPAIGELAVEWVAFRHPLRADRGPNGCEPPVEPRNRVAKLRRAILRIVDVSHFVVTTQNRALDDNCAVRRRSVTGQSAVDIESSTHGSSGEASSPALKAKLLGGTSPADTVSVPPVALDAQTHNPSGCAGLD